MESIDEDPGSGAIHDEGPIRVLHRTGCWCPGWQRGRCAAFDLQLPARQGYPAAMDRCYLLLDEGVQLTQPFRYTGTDIEGWWYIDVVRIESVPEGLIVHDMYVDVLVPRHAERYDVLDLDDLADAMTSGVITTSEAARTLNRTQRFLERHLMNPERREADPAHVFPPEPVRTLRALPPFAMGDAQDTSPGPG